MTSKPLPEEDLLHVVKEAGGVWEELRGRTIFVTGATGFVGRWMLESLLAADYTHGLDVRVVALSRDPDRFRSANPHLAVWSGLRWVAGSVTTLIPAALDCPVDLVIHLATEADLAATLADPNAATEVIVGGTLRVLEAASQAGARRFLFTSSGSVYGPRPEGVTLVAEDYPLPSAGPGKRDAGTVGAEAKRQAEKYCADFTTKGRIDAVIARCFTFAGPGLPVNGKFAFGNFMGDALAGRRVTVRGNGTPVRSYMYGSDLAVWLWKLLIQGTAGGVYNVGSEHAIRLQELAETIASELGAPGVEVMQQRLTGEPTDCYVPSTQKVRGQLGLQETLGIRQAIHKTADWLRH